MKVILTGVTGFIGTEVLLQCRLDPAITSIVALTRRRLSEEISNDPKVTVIVMKDFKNYPDNVLEQLRDADACIWSMGTTEAIPEIEIDYPVAFAQAFMPLIAESQKPFRYMHCSGRLAEKDQTKRLFFLQEGRRIKGIAELEMLALEKQPEVEGLWQTFIVKPSRVLPKKGEKSDLRWLGSCIIIGSVHVEELAAAMIDIIQKGSHIQISDNSEVVMRGRAALDKGRWKPCRLFTT